MNTSLEDLKKRATASELTLIHAVETALRDGVRKEITLSTIRYVEQNIPPSREDVMMNPDLAKNWFTRFQKHLNPDAQ